MTTYGTDGTAVQHVAFTATGTSALTLDGAEGSNAYSGGKGGDGAQVGGDIHVSISITEEPLCFLRGTRILTPAGEIPVEDLQIGDTVSTLSAGNQKIRWIGTGTLMIPPGRRSPATPVIIRRGAVAENTPSRDLRVTKGHGLYIDSVFIPAEFLVNHRSIVWDDAAQEADYFHIECDAHEVLVADGMPAESYRDEGNRWMFANANPGWDQPGIAPQAPVITRGEKLDAIWQRLARRAESSLAVETTQNPDLHLLVDGMRIDAWGVEAGVYTFELPALLDSVAIVSRAAAQDVIGRARDPRLLGVAISKVVIQGADHTETIGARSLADGTGFHAYEPDEDCTWTCGYAKLSLENAAGAFLQIHLRHTTHYRQPQRTAA